MESTTCTEKYFQNRRARKRWAKEGTLFFQARCVYVRKVSNSVVDWREMFYIAYRNVKICIGADGVGFTILNFGEHGTRLYFDKKGNPTHNTEKRLRVPDDWIQDAVRLSGTVLEKWRAYAATFCEDDDTIFVLDHLPAIRWVAEQYRCDPLADVLLGRVVPIFLAGAMKNAQSV